MTRTFTPFLKRLLLALALGTGFTAKGQVIPQPVALASSSFTADIVANGANQAAPGTSATDADGASNFFPSVDYTTTGAPDFFHPTLGLPYGGSFLSSGTPNVRFDLASYSANNALRLSGAVGASTATGTLTFATATTASTLYVLATCGSGPKNVTLTVNFSDGTSQALVRAVPDWYATTAQANGTTTAYNLNTRINGSNAFENLSSAGNPRLFQLMLPLSAVNSVKPIGSITVTKTEANGFVQILAVSAAQEYLQVPVTFPATGTVATAASNTFAMPSSNGQDVVANGTGQTSPANSARDADASGYYLMSNDYTTSTAPTTTRTQGLPTTGTIPSAATPGLAYQMGPFAGVNSLHIRGNTSGTLPFVTPRSATEVYVLANTVVLANTPTGSMVVNFSDGTFRSFPVTYSNWFTTSGVAPASVAFGTNARVRATGNTIETYTNGTPNLFEFKLVLTSAEATKTITSVTVSGHANTVLSILAVSVKASAQPACAAAPTSIGTVASTATACPSTSISLNLTSLPSQLGYTYQWQYLNSSSSWVNIPSTSSATEPVSSNGTNATCTVTNQTYATRYRCQIACANDVAGGSRRTAEVAVGQTNFIDCYCNPLPSTTNSCTLGRVSSVNVNNSSGLSQTLAACATVPYNSYGIVLASAATGTLLKTGVTYTLAVGVANSSRVSAWLDANQSGTYDASEYFTLGTVTGAGTVSAVIPAALLSGALTGNTKLRIRTEGSTASVLLNSNNACTTTANGETLDYTVTIPAPVACAGTLPAITATPSTTAAVCANAPFTITASGPAAGTTGLTYQWQYRATGSGAAFANVPATITNIDGTTTTTAATTATVTISNMRVPTDYQVIVTCTASSSTATSNTVAMTYRYLDCYCAPISGANVNSEYIKIVTFPGTPGFTNPVGSQHSAPPAGPPSANGYGDFTANTALTTTLNQGATYVSGATTGVRVTVRSNNTNSQGGMWIDYDHSGTFDPSEYLFLGTSSLIATDVTFQVALVVPAVAELGQTRVRVRWRNGGFTSSEACLGGLTTWYGETEDYFINIVAPPTCTAPPATVTASADVVNACANASFALSSSSIPTTLGGYTYQWQSRPAGSSTAFADITGATTNPYTVASQTAATDYQLVVSCQYGGTPVASNVVAVGQNTFDQCYCTTSSTNGCSQYGSITNVSIGSINNTTTCAASSYTVFAPGSTTTTDLNMAAGNALSIAVANNPSTNTYNYGVWIDFNQNGTFDSSEFVSNSTLSRSTSPVTATITIPAQSATVLSGPTRMRIRTNAGIYPIFGAGDACVVTYNGETEDYTVTLVAPTACSGTPPTTVASASTGTTCPNSAFTLTASGLGNVTGVTTQWESAPAGTTTFAAISSATGTTYTVASQTAATDYRFKVTCTASGVSAYSNVQSVGQNSFMTCYCLPPSQSNIGNGEYLTNVRLGSINNTSANPVTTPVGYSDYTISPTATQTTILSRGTTYPVSVSAQNNRQNSQAVLWIDYDHSGTFDSNEILLVGTGPSATTGYPRQEVFNNSLTIPMTALTGPTHLRVRWHNDSPSTNPCATDWYGETEEYIVTITDDLIVTTTTTIPAGSYNNVTIMSTGNGTLTGATSVAGALVVQSGGTFSDGCQALTGTGSFVLAAGATLNICNPVGIAATGPVGAVQLPVRMFSSAASYVYNGTAGQSTGTGLPAQIRNLTVNNSAGVSLTQPVAIRRLLTLTNGNLLNGQLLTLRSDADSTALVMVGTPGGQVVGEATVQRYIAGISGPGYRHFSAPITTTTATVGDIGALEVSQGAAYNSSATPGSLTPFPTVFGYNEQVQASSPATGYSMFDRGWVAAASLGDAMQAGKGYTVNIAGQQMVDFVGTLGTGNVPVALTRGTTTDAGWNLLGNPYPSTLNWDNVTKPTGMDEALYTYQSTSQYVGTYTVYTNGMSTSNTRTSTVPMGQAFFVRLSAGQPSAQLTFTDAARTADFATAGTFQRSNDPRPRVKLALQNAGATLTDAAYVYFEAGATAGIDARHDATKLPNPTGLNVSAWAAGTELAINGLPVLTTRTVVPLGVTVPQAGTYTLHAAELLNLGTTQVYLLDALTGQTISLNQQPRYTFSTAGAAVLAGRFSLSFLPAAALATQTTLTAAGVQVFPNPAHTRFTLLVPAVANAQQVQTSLYNSLGQRVRTQTDRLGAAGLQATVEVAGLATGIYTLQVQVGQEVITKRLTVE